MTMAIIASFLTGIVIGFRFKIFIVVPAMFIVGLSAAAIAVAQGEPFWTIMSTAVVCAIGVQVGYLCGSFPVSLKEVPTADSAPVTTASADTYNSAAAVSVHFSDR